MGYRNLFRLKGVGKLLLQWAEEEKKEKKNFQHVEEELAEKRSRITTEPVSPAAVLSLICFHMMFFAL